MAESGAGSGREDTQVSHTAKSDCVGEIDFKKLCHSKCNVAEMLLHDISSSGRSGTIVSERCEIRKFNEILK